MAEKDQVKPLTPAGHQPRSDGEDDYEAMHAKSNNLRRKQLYIQCCGCLSVLLIVPTVMIIVVLTVCHVKHPSLRMNSVSIQRPLEVVNGTTTTGGRDQNLTLLVDFLVKNPNYASFKFRNATTVLYYGGTVVGEGQIPAGLQAKARRTIWINVTVDIIIPEKALLGGQSGIMSTGTLNLNMSSYTRIAGKVKMLNIIKKNMVLGLNCSFMYNVSGQAIQDNCSRQHVHF
ncbi:hypothetical protein ACOSP7_024595 [Xanthoceras sorbifolium]|uniref:Late embryogenesis abundant protein LEA-2 subgroup domain-containing protein n=1 Tax=Xanthoceras sorbifolium TaxID=99658 RepID=A0ABQ8H8F0_9ROSI|nr:hypothetical protein JRO89_XS13G0153300 [Xanthoceras sorbifolium]